MGRELIVTPPAPCRWAKVLDPLGYPAFDETKPRQWSIELIFDPSDREHAEFLGKAEDLFQKHHGSERKGNYWWPGKEGEGDDKGKMLLRFKINLLTFKNGNTTQPPLVQDVDGRPWSEDKKIGNGSIVRVAFDVYAWKSPGIGAGMTFQPRHIQVVEHIPYADKEGAVDASNPFGTPSIFN